MVASSASLLIAWDSSGRSKGDAMLLSLCAVASARMLFTISVSMLSRVAERTTKAPTAMQVTNEAQTISQTNLRVTPEFTSFSRASSCS
ncbi:hypothetical protein D3C72_828260 [compost metagenome]